MRLPWLALSLGSALALAPAASAGVLVVDPANGPGADFTSLSDAMSAAASGDILLLRSGTYDGHFAVGGKSLSIVADDGASVTITNSGAGGAGAPALHLGSQDDFPVIVRGLQLATTPAGSVPLLVTGTATASGQVYIEECTVNVSGDAALVLDNVSPATVSRCSLNGADGSLAAGTLGRPGLVVDGGPFAMFGGFVVGGEGRDAGLLSGATLVPGQDGESGVQIDAGDFTVKRISGAGCIGGLGGDGAAPGGNCLPPGDGGDGVLTVAGGDVLFTGSFGIGDLGGTAAPGCGPNGTQGLLLGSIPPAPLPQFTQGIPGSVVLPRARREKQSVPITVQAPLDQSMALLVGFAPMFSDVPSLNGVQVVSPASVVNLGQLPFTGTLTFHWRVPELGPGVEGMFAWLQPITTHASGVQTLGQPSVILMLDESF